MINKVESKRILRIDPLQGEKYVVTVTSQYPISSTQNDKILHFTCYTHPHPHPPTHTYIHSGQFNAVGVMLLELRVSERAGN